MPTYISSIAANSGILDLTSLGIERNDLILAAGHKPNATNSVILPSGYNWRTQNWNLSTLGVVWRVATGDETQIEFTGSNVLNSAVAIYRPSPNKIIVPNQITLSASTTDTFSYPTLSNAQASTVGDTVLNRFVGFGCCRNNNGDANIAPTNMVNLVSTAGAALTDGALAIHDTNGEIGSWTAQTVVSANTLAAWRTLIVELVEFNIPTISKRIYTNFN